MRLENEYFSDGITEDLITALSKVSRLHVAARTSSFAFKGKNDDMHTIGTQLNVGAVLEGSVAKAGNQVRITAQLINVADAALAAAQHAYYAGWWTVDPELDPLRSDPRFAALLKRAGLEK